VSQQRSELLHQAAVTLNGEYFPALFDQLLGRGGTEPAQPDHQDRSIVGGPPWGVWGTSQ
jgi:hypothetical protein